MSLSSICRALLSKGYFPKELPPTFTTTDFGTHSEYILQNWKQSGIYSRRPQRANRNSYYYKLTDSEAETISMPKRGYERRHIHITHPVPQALICREMAENWVSIYKWLSRRKFSEDKILISNEYERSVKGINFPLHQAKLEYIQSASDWTVKTDISRFYPSIYTHSIPWAAYGKERVKRDLKRYRGSFADRLDCLLRSCNRNQTIGIPIGPETSRIVAEIISSRIDSEFVSCCDELSMDKIDRLQDDWIVGADSLDDAERVLSTIGHVYRSYELDINGSKTSIKYIVASPSATWKSEIGSFLSHRPGSLRGARLEELLRLSLQLQSANPSDPVVNYALSVVESTKLGQRRGLRSSDIEALESFLLKAAVIAPNSMDRMCRVLLNLQHETNGVSVKRVVQRLVLLTERNLEKGHTYETIWLLYLLRGLRRPIGSKVITELTEQLPSSSLALVLLDMKEKGIWSGALPTESWEKMISQESMLSSWIWLLAYEGFRNGWLRDGKTLMSKKFLKPMAEKNVVFYDPKRNIKKSQKAVEMSNKRRRGDIAEAQRILIDLREVMAQEY